MLEMQNPADLECTITDFVRRIKKDGVVTHTICVDPPIVYTWKHNGKCKFFRRPFISLGTKIEPQYTDLTVGSKIQLKIIEVYKPFFEQGQSNDDPITTEKVNELSIDLLEAGDGEKFIIDTCPSCGEKLKNYNGVQVCNNCNCAAQKLEKFTHFIRSLGMHLHGEYYQIFCTLITRGLINSFPDIFLTKDESIRNTIENITDRQVNLYKALVCDVLGKISMTELLHGVCILPDSDPSEIRKFVIYQNEKLGGLTVSKLIELCENAVEKYNLKSSSISVLDDIIKLSDENESSLKEEFGDIGSLRISSIIDYVTNSINKEVLKTLERIDLLLYSK